MIVDDIEEMKVVAAFDRGKPNQERIVIEVLAPANTGQYGLFLGIKAEGNSAFPLRDNFLWFGDGIVYPSQLIFVYTGQGESVKSTLPGSDIVTYSLHWGRPTTVLDNPEVVPLLMRIGAVTVLQDEQHLTIQRKGQSSPDKD